MGALETTLKVVASVRRRSPRFGRWRAVSAAADRRHRRRAFVIPRWPLPPTTRSTPLHRAVQGRHRTVANGSSEDSKKTMGPIRRFGHENIPPEIGSHQIRARG
jgi:hypothetical protein